MSADEEKAVVRTFVREVFQDRREAAVDDLVGADFRSHTWGRGGTDRDGLKAAMGRLAGSLADVRFSIEDLIAEDDLVVARLTASATQVGPFMGLPASNRRYEIGEIHIFRVRDGRIVEHWHRYDQLGLLQQLGAPMPA